MLSHVCPYLKLGLPLGFDGGATQHLEQWTKVQFKTNMRILLRGIGNDGFTPIHRELLSEVGTGAHIVDHVDGVTGIESAGQGHTEGHVAASRGITTRLIAESTSGQGLRGGGDAGAFKPGTRTKHKLIRLVQGIGVLASLPIREGAVHGSTLRHIHTDPATSELTSLPFTLLFIQAAH